MQPLPLRWSHAVPAPTHEEAEVIAATVATMPDSLGGKRMTIRVAELARAGLTPDWMPGPCRAVCLWRFSETSMRNGQAP
jgi:hypothetical protein